MILYIFRYTVFKLYFYFSYCYNSFRLINQLPL